MLDKIRCGWSYLSDWRELAYKSKKHNKTLPFHSQKFLLTVSQPSSRFSFSLPLTLSYSLVPSLSLDCRVWQHFTYK